MCTSMSPDSRITVAPMPGPVSAAASRPRRLTPITSCVAFTDRAKSTSARGTSSPTTWWYDAAERLDERSLLGQGPGRRRAQPVLAA